MDRRVRALIHAVFIGAFLVSAPLVVLYTAGYRIHFPSLRIVHTAVLAASSIPKGANVAVDGVETDQRTPAVLSDLLPGERTVRLTREGYLPWEKNVTLKSRETAFVADALLYADMPPSFVADASAALGTDAKRRFLAYARPSDAWLEIWALEAEHGDHVLLARLPPESSVRVEWSADARHVALLSRTSEGPVVHLVDVQTGNPLPIADLQGEGWWDPQRPERFYLRHQGRVDAYDVPLARPAALPFDAQAAASSGAEYLIVQEVEERAALSLWRREAPKLLAYLPAGDYAFRESPIQDAVLLEERTSNRILLVDTGGTGEPILLNAHAISWQWEPGGRRLAYTDGFDIRLYDADAHREETITRLSEPITSVTWHPSGAAVLFTQGAHLNSLELDASGSGRVHTVLAKGHNLTHIVLDVRGRVLYVFGGMGDEPTGISQRVLQR